jgi:TldD protein
VKLLERLEAMARAEDPRVKEVMASLVGTWEVVLVARSDGHLAADMRPLVRVSVTVIMEENGRREQGSAAAAGATTTATSAMRCSALRQGGGAPGPRQPGRRPGAGRLMTVVLGNGWPGILLHEAIGHGLEGDFNRKEARPSPAASASRWRPRASRWSTTAPCRPPRFAHHRRRGQPHPAHRADRGRHPHRLHAGHAQRPPDGRRAHRQRRRESFAHLPLPRMTNTIMLAGQHEPAEIIASVKNGLYAANFGGGQVDITSGKFVFSTSECYLIEDGKVTRPVKGATLIGNGPDCLTRVSMIGNDLALDPGVGTCGKDGQSVPVGSASRPCASTA